MRARARARFQPDQTIMSMLLSLSLSAARTKKQKLEVIYLKDEMILSSAYASDRTMRLATRHTWGAVLFELYGSANAHRYCTGQS